MHQCNAIKKSQSFSWGGGGVYHHPIQLLSNSREVWSFTRNTTGDDTDRHTIKQWTLHIVSLLVLTADRGWNLFSESITLPLVTWFQYMGNKQFRLFFGAEFDPNGHKNHGIFFFWKSNFFYQKDTPNLLFWWWLYERWQNNQEKENTFLAVNIKIKC